MLRYPDIALRFNRAQSQYLLYAYAGSCFRIQVLTNCIQHSKRDSALTLRPAVIGLPGDDQRDRAVSGANYRDAAEVANV